MIVAACVPVGGGFRFVASRHPAVLRGNATVDEVRKELLDTFLSEGAGEARYGRVRGFSANAHTYSYTMHVILPFAPSK